MNFIKFTAITMTVLSCSMCAYSMSPRVCPPPITVMNQNRTAWVAPANWSIRAKRGHPRGPVPSFQGAKILSSSGGVVICFYGYPGDTTDALNLTPANGKAYHPINLPNWVYVQYDSTSYYLCSYSVMGNCPFLRN